MNPELPTYPTKGILPKTETQASTFVSENPQYDGRGVVVAIFDTGVDPGALGLQTTTEGKPKIIDIVDCSGSGDCDTSTFRTAENGTLKGLSGRILNIGNWANVAGNKYRVGLKHGYDLYPGDLKGRMKSKREKVYVDKQREKKNELFKLLSNAELGADEKKELERQVELIDSVSYKDVGPIHDVVAWQEQAPESSESEPTLVWKVAVDVNEDGDLTRSKVLGDYAVDRTWNSFPESNLNYSVKVYDNGNVVTLVTNAGSHGTHVAGIVAAHFPDQPELNGVAPGAQIVSVKIGDSRLGSMETGSSLVRGLILAQALKVDLINMSYGEPTSNPDQGRISALLKDCIEKSGITFVGSAGNNGPGLSTVGAPGATARGSISVGAMVSPAMMSVEYSLRDTEDRNDMQYTWSSRGPVPNGSLGVSVSAPGGAIAPIPNWTLSKSSLMNGTSMSSPNCCGCLALVISALKANKTGYSPASLKRSLENTALWDANRDNFTQGYGLVQVAHTYEHASKFSEQHSVSYSVTTAGGKLGYYVREAHEMKANELTLNVEPVFLPDCPDQVKIAFERRIQITSTAPWVKVPDSFYLLNASRSFKFHVDPTELPVGPSYGEIQGWDSACVGLGPIFRFPITVIKPITLQPGSFSQTFPGLKFSPGEIHRFFISVPEGATWAKVKISTKGVTPKRLFAYQHCQILPQQSIKWTMFDKYVWMGEDSKESFKLDVSAGHTIEVNFAQYWSSSGTSGVGELSITFNGVSINTYGGNFHLSAGSHIRTELRASLRNQSLKFNALLTTIVKSLSPTSSTINNLSDPRDLLPDGRRINQLVNTYTYQAESSHEIIPRLPTISQVLYDSPFEAQFWMIFNEENELIGSGDFVPTNVKLPRKGTYTIKIQFRDEKSATLNGLQNYPLWIERSLAKDKQIALTCYSNIYNLLTGAPKITSVSLTKDQTYPLLIAAPESSKIPKEAAGADMLIGYFSTRQTTGDEIPFSIAESGLKPPIAGTLITFQLPQPKKTGGGGGNSGNGFTYDPKKSGAENSAEHEKYSALDYVQLLLAKGNLDEAATSMPALLKKYTNFLPLLQTNISLHLQIVSKDKNAATLGALIEATDLVINYLDAEAIAMYFGTLHEEGESKTKVKEKEALVSALNEKAIAFYELYQLDKELGTQSFHDTVKELGKWVKVKEDAKYLPLYLKSELIQGHYSVALKAVTKALSSATKEMFLLEIQLLEQLQWYHCAENRKQQMLLSFPPNTRLF